MNRVYREQTGREMSDYVLVQQGDKVVRYNQLPPEAELVRRALLSPGLFRTNSHTQPNVAEDAAEIRGAFRLSKQHLFDEHGPNVLLSTNELASLTGFKPKTIRRWVSRKLLNYIRVGNRLRFRPAAVELFLAQREVRRLDSLLPLEFSNFGNSKRVFKSDGDRRAFPDIVHERGPEARDASSTVMPHARVHNTA